MSAEKHIIFTAGRSGSNFLVDVLNSHDEIVNYGEILGDYVPSFKLHKKFGYGGKNLGQYCNFELTSRTHFFFANTYSKIRRIASKKKPRTKRWGNIASVGFKEFSQRMHLLGLESYLKENEDIKVVHLFRDDILARAISLHNLRVNGVVHVTGDSKEIEKFEVDPEVFLDLVQNLSQETKVQFQTIKDLDPERVLDVSYQDLFSSPESQSVQLKRVFNHLGVEPIEVVSDHRKILPATIWDTLSNAEEIAQKLIDNGYVELIPPREPNSNNII